MNTIITLLSVIETTAFLSGMSCCICRKEVSDRKKRILLFGSTKKAVSVRNSLASYLREESNRNITEGELRGRFRRTMPVWNAQTALSCMRS